MEQEGLSLRATHTSVAADQLLEGGDLAELGIVDAVHEQVADVSETVEPTQMLGSSLSEWRHGV